MAPVATWSEWITELARVPGDTYKSFVGSEYRFPSDRGLIVVHEGGPVAHGGDSVRARCTTSGRAYDLRRLRAGARAGGLVALEALEALDREANLVMKAGATKAGVLSHTVRCYATLIENSGASHCRLLLCDSCSTDLGAYLLTRTEGLPPAEIADIGQQLAFGLGHLHGLGILFGSMAPAGILRGQDGLWKLGTFERSAELPITALEWRDQCAGAGRPLEALAEIPPEARGFSTAELRPEADVWLLGHLIAVILLKEANTAGTSGADQAFTMLAAAPSVLEKPYAARLWLFLHWLLAVDPADRPNANETAALISTVAQALPQEMLQEMPSSARRHCRSTAVAAARQLAVDQALKSAGTAEHDWLVRRLTGLPLAELRRELADTSQVDLLCTNCGIDVEQVDRVDRSDR